MITEFPPYTMQYILTVPGAMDGRDRIQLLQQGMAELPHHYGIISGVFSELITNP
jgi:hypothetical protein